MCESTLHFPNFLYQDCYNMPFYNFVIVIRPGVPKKVLNSFLQLTDTVITNNFYILLLYAMPLGFS